MVEPSNDTKLTILNDHYKETVASFKQTGKNRDSNFLAMLVLIGIMAFQYVSPTQSQSLLTQLAHKKLGIDASLSVNFLGSLVWFVLLYASVRYFQAVINLEKEYNYTHALEEQLSKHYNGEAFTREGRSYLKNYPIFSEWLHIVYRSIFPALLAVTITIKIIGECQTKPYLGLPIILDVLIYLALIISIALYTYSLHKAEKDNEADV